MKKTPRKTLKALQTFSNNNGFAKTAVALGYTDVNAIRNWLQRKEIPESKRELVNDLVNLEVKTVRTDMSELNL